MPDSGRAGPGSSGRSVRTSLHNDADLNWGDPCKEAWPDSNGLAQFLEHPERVHVRPALRRQCLFGPFV